MDDLPRGFMFFRITEKQIAFAFLISSILSTCVYLCYVLYWTRTNRLSYLNIFTQFELHKSDVPGSGPEIRDIRLS